MMRRRQKLALQKQRSEVVEIAGEPVLISSRCPLCGHENAPPSLPGNGADAGQEAPSTPAPQGITYLHDEHTRVTLGSWDFDPTKVKLRDMNDYPQQLDAAVERQKRGRKKAT
jgi:hypothetical protein